MAFTLKSASIDIGETPLENIFINNYMNLADEIQLKVYILGLSMAKHADKNMGNQDIAISLNIRPEQVKEAWLFWKQVGLVDFLEPQDKEECNFDINFISLREEYIKSNYMPKTSKNTERKRLLYDREIKELFDSAEIIVNKPLSPDDRIKAIEWMTEFNISKELFLKALRITFHERSPQVPSLKYAKGILQNWHNNNIRTVKEAEAYEEEFLRQSEIYREVNARLLSKTTMPTKAQIRIIDSILEKTKSKDILLRMVDICTLDLVYPTYKSLNALSKKLEKKYSLTKRGIDQYMEEKTYSLEAKEDKGKRTIKQSQNFQQKTYQKMSKEDGIKAMRRNNPALQLDLKRSKIKDDK